MQTDEVADCIDLPDDKYRLSNTFYLTFNFILLSALECNNSNGAADLISLLFNCYFYLHYINKNTK